MLRPAPVYRLRHRSVGLCAGDARWERFLSPGFVFPEQTPLQGCPSDGGGGEQGRLGKNTICKSAVKPSG